MIMADVSAVFGTLLALGIAIPGLMLTWQLLFPKVVNRAETRLQTTPWKSFFGGLIVLAIFLTPILILFNLPGSFAQFLGFTGVFVGLTFASIGTAGLSKLMGVQLQKNGTSLTVTGVMVRGAVAMELAAIVPFIGWFIFLPLAFIASLGAVFFALLKWKPRVKTQPAPAPEIPVSA